MGEIKKYIRESKLIKISKDLTKLNSSIEKAKNILQQKLKKEPSDYELSLFLEIDINKIQEAKNANLILKSLDYENDNENELYDFIGYNEGSYNIDHILLKEEVKKLSKEEQILILKRYKEGLTQTELSKELGVSQVKISRQEKDILTRLRTRMTN